MGQPTPATGGQPVFLYGERVDLRAIELEDVALIHRWGNAPNGWGPFQAPRPTTLSQAQKRFSEGRSVSEEGGALLAVLKDGTPIGELSYHREWYGSSSPAFNMGIVLAPEHRGKGYGSEAQRLLADYLLYAFPIGRVEASTDIENVAEQRALERAGFVREGVARSASWRGAWHDMVVYSRIRGDA